MSARAEFALLLGGWLLGLAMVVSYLFTQASFVRSIASGPV